MVEPSVRRPRNRHRAESRYETIVRRVAVRSVSELAPDLVRITLGGAELGEFDDDNAIHSAVESRGFDDVVVFCLPDPDSGRVTVPLPGPGGGLLVPPAGRVVAREYTVRALSGGVMTVDLVRHCDGPGMRWLATARPGDEVAVVAPRVSRAMPKVDSMLAVGDASAIPALARLVEGYPAGAVLDVVAVVPDRRRLPGSLLQLGSARAGVTVRVVEDSPGSSRAAVDALAEFAPAHQFAWVACESGMVGDIRRVLIERGQPVDRIQFTGYWRLGGPL